MANAKIIEHVDFFGEPLDIGDLVVAADGGNRGALAICRITKITPKMITLQSVITKYSYKRSSFLRYPYYVIKVNSDVVADYILQNH